MTDVRRGASPDEWQHFDRVLGLGPYMVPTVCERASAISRYSKLKKAGKVPSFYIGNKQVVGMVNWPRIRSTPAQRAAWAAEPDYGFCLVTGPASVCAFDIDLDNEADVAQAVAIFGPHLPARTRPDSPRQLLMFRTDGVRYKQVLHTDHGIIEILATGSQFVACGEHEDGARYTWDGLPSFPIPFLSWAEVEQKMIESRPMGNRDWTVPKRLATPTILAPGAVIADDPVEDYLRFHEQVKGTSPTGGLYVVCPFAAGHGKQGDATQTVYFLAGTGGFAQGHIQCLDAGCAEYKDADFLEAWGVTEWLQLDGFDVLPAVTPLAVTQALVAGVAQEAGAPALDRTRILQEYLDVRHGDGTRIPLTHKGMVTRFVTLLDGRARFIPETGGWWFWDGTRWVADHHQAMLMAHTARIEHRLYHEATDLIQAGRSKAAMTVLDWALTVQRKNEIDAILALTQKEMAIRLPQDQLNAHPLCVGLDQGRQCLDLETGLCRPARQDDYLTRSLGVSTCRPSTEAVRWRQFLSEVLHGDQALIDWLQRWCGYLLTAETREHCLLFLYGSGRNGKSVFLSLLMRLMGDYGATVQSETLTETTRSGQGPSPDIARLAGLRFVASSETSDGRAFAEGLVKQLTGGDRVSARYLHQNSFEFTPQFKLMIAGNHKPVVKGTDLGIWRRLHLVPFTRTFTEAEADPLLTRVLEAEAPAILGWMVEGAAQWLTGGLGRTPARVSEATKQYQSEMDTMGEFFQEECTFSATLETSTSALFFAYKEWCTRCNRFAPSRQRFTSTLEERAGVHMVHKKSGNFLQGVGLKAQLSTGFQFNMQEITCEELL